VCVVSRMRDSLSLSLPLSLCVCVCVYMCVCGCGCVLLRVCLCAYFRVCVCVFDQANSSHERPESLYFLMYVLVCARV